MGDVPGLGPVGPFPPVVLLLDELSSQLEGLLRLGLGQTEDQQTTCQLEAFFYSILSDLLRALELAFKKQLPCLF